MTEETLVWSGNVSSVTHLTSFILLGLLSLPVVTLIVTLPLMIILYLSVKSHRYELTTQRLKVYTGILSKRVDEVELYRVKDTRCDQPFSLRLFNLGNVVVISSDSTSPKITIEAIPNPKELREQLRNIVEECRDRKKVRTVENE